MTTTEFKGIKEPWEMPVPHYRGMLGEDTLYVFTRGQGREALEWLRARGTGFRLVQVMYDPTSEAQVVRELARN